MRLHLHLSPPSVIQPPIRPCLLCRGLPEVWRWLPLRVWPCPPLQQTTPEQVRSKIPSRYRWTVGASTASGSCDRSPSPAMATLLPPMLTQGHPEWQPHANIPKGEWTKPTLCFAFLQIYQPGEEQSDTDLSHMFWNRKKQAFHFPPAESSRAWHPPLLWGTKPNVLSLNGRRLIFALLWKKIVIWVILAWF